MIEESDLEKLEAAARRLHSEVRLANDEMRDLGHLIGIVAKRARDVEIPADLT